MTELTPKEKQRLDYIREYWLEGSRMVDVFIREDIAFLLGIIKKQTKNED